VVTIGVNLMPERLGWAAAPGRVGTIRRGLEHCKFPAGTLWDSTHRLSEKTGVCPDRSLLPSQSGPKIV